MKETSSLSCRPLLFVVVSASVIAAAARFDPVPLCVSAGCPEVYRRSNAAVASIISLRRAKFRAPRGRPRWMTDRQHDVNTASGRRRLLLSAFCLQLLLRRRQMIRQRPPCRWQVAKASVGFGKFRTEERIYQASRRVGLATGVCVCVDPSFIASNVRGHLQPWACCTAPFL